MSPLRPIRLRALRTSVLSVLNLSFEGCGRIGIFHRLQAQALGRCRGPGTTAVTLFQQMGYLTGGKPAAAYLQERANNLPHHVPQKGCAANDINPFLSV